MSVHFTIVDAFTDKAFSGNPAAVVVLEEEDIADDLKQKIAREFNASDTAFLRLIGDQSESPTYEICWFTPKQEVELCGHATLASAFVLFTGPAKSAKVITFQTRYSGQLQAKLVDDGSAVELVLPVDQAVLDEGTDFQGEERQAVVRAVAEACPGVEQYIKRIVRHRFGDLVEFDFEKNGKKLEDLNVNTSALGQLPSGTSIWTSPSPDDTAHFVSRVFPVNHGVPEDPVTGSAHCALAPYWLSSGNRGKLRGSPAGQTVLAKQVSERGGFVKATWEQESSRVFIVGKAVKTAEGTLYFQ